MSRIDEIHEELKQLLGNECVIVMQETYNSDAELFLKTRSQLEIAHKALVDVSSEVWKENVPAILAAKVRRIVEEAFKE